MVYFLSMRSFVWTKPLEELTPEERVQAAAWALQVVDADIAYYQKLWEKGRSCLEFVEGKIFSPAEIDSFQKHDDIMPVQTPELKPAMDAIMGQLLNTGKSGKIIGAGTEDADGAYIRTIVLKETARENELEYRESQIARDTFTTSVPGWLWIEAYDPNKSEEPGITLCQEDWDAVVPDPGWHDRQLRDLTRATRVRRWGLDEIEQFVQDPMVKERILRNWEGMSAHLPDSYDGRATLIQRIKNQRAEFDRTNKLAVYEMTHWVKMPALIWHNMETAESGVVPQNWTPEELQVFQEQNPYVQIVTERHRVLWVTTVTGSGVLVANGPHWLQSGMFPGSPCVPDRLNGKWAGLVEFVMDTVKGGAYAETMAFHAIRTLTSNLWLAEQGAIADKEAFKVGLTKVNHVEELQEGHTIDSVKKIENSREQRAFVEWHEVCRQKLGRLLVPDNFVGGVQSSQEANAAIETRIEQTLSRLAPVVYGWHSFRRRNRRLILSAMPYAITAKKVYRHLDPTNGMSQEITVNDPVDWDIWGNVVATVNNLDGDTYDYIESEDDDSKTGKQMADKDLLAFFEASANIPPEQREAAALASTSHAVQAYGKNLKKMRENAPPPAPEAKFSVALNANELGANPLAQKAAVALGLISQEDLDSLKSQPPDASGLPAGQSEPILPDGSGMGDPAVTEGMAYA